MASVPPNLEQNLIPDYVLRIERKEASERLAAIADELTALRTKKRPIASPDEQETLDKKIKSLLAEGRLIKQRILRLASLKEHIDEPLSRQSFSSERSECPSEATLGINKNARNGVWYSLSPFAPDTISVPPPKWDMDKQQIEIYTQIIEEHESSIERAHQEKEKINKRLQEITETCRELANKKIDLQRRINNTEKDLTEQEQPRLLRVARNDEEDYSELEEKGKEIVGELPELHQRLHQLDDQIKCLTRNKSICKEQLSDLLKQEVARYDTSSHYRYRLFDAKETQNKLSSPRSASTREEKLIAFGIALASLALISFATLGIAGLVGLSLTASAYFYTAGAVGLAGSGYICASEVGKQRSVAYRATPRV